MKLFIGLVTPDERLRAFFGRGKSGVIPPEALMRPPWGIKGANVTTLAWTPDEKVSAETLQKFLVSKAREHTACLLLVDSAWLAYVRGIETAAFISPFDSAGFAGNPQNFFSGLISRSLRAFGQLLGKFNNAGDAQLLSLPLRNFKAEELRELANLCGAGPGQGAWSDEIEAHLARLRKRVRPRKKSSYKTLYAVDDDGKFFVYGKERHSQFATSAPHLPSCEIAGLFRFGARLDERRHYNVSRTETDLTSIAGEFSDCHDTVRTEKQRTHLNMFANDYF